MKNPGFTFVDLFAGIGGFSLALDSIGGTCVGAVEIDEAAAEVFRSNFGFDPSGDLTKLATDKKVVVPRADVLTAGFPCQPFSKSGNQRGMEDTRGTLFWNLAHVIKKNKPVVVILENVRNLYSERHSGDWEIIISTLRELGYHVSDKPTILSPHLIPPQLGGTPQIRERIFITATLLPSRLRNLEAPTPALEKGHFKNLWSPSSWRLERDLPLERRKNQRLMVTNKEAHWLDAWDDFVNEIRKSNDAIPGFPLWADVWLGNMPKHRSMPGWKIDFWEKNMKFYENNKRAINRWSKRWDLDSETFPPSRRKLEWQAQDESTIWNCAIHLRPSGIRAKKLTYLPALVAMNQAPIIGPKRRRISVKEAARLQGFPDTFGFGEQIDAFSLKQLGNAVNVGVVKLVFLAHCRRDRDILQETCPSLLQAIDKEIEEIVKNLEFVD